MTNKNIVITCPREIVEIDFAEKRFSYCTIDSNGNFAFLTTVGDLSEVRRFFSLRGLNETFRKYEDFAVRGIEKEVEVEKDHIFQISVRSPFISRPYWE